MNEPTLLDKFVWAVVGAMLAAALLLALTSCLQPASAYMPPKVPTQTAVQTTAPQVATHIYISDQPTPESETWTVTAETLYVRSGPSMTYRTIRHLEQGDIIKVREWSHNGNGWAMIAPAEWVNADYLERIP